MKAGKHVLVEKPMCASVAEGEELTAIAKSQKVTLMVDHTFLFTGAVRKIKQLIDAEGPSAILSDDTIVERLRASGIDIARRTVAKYREAMRIPSSVQRRRDKQATVKHRGE